MKLFILFFAGVPVVLEAPSVLLFKNSFIPWSSICFVMKKYFSHITHERKEFTSVHTSFPFLYVPLSLYFSLSFSLTRRKKKSIQKLHFYRAGSNETRWKADYIFHKIRWEVFFLAFRTLICVLYIYTTIVRTYIHFMWIKEVNWN